MKFVKRLTNKGDFYKLIADERQTTKGKSMEAECFFCKRLKADVPALVTGEQGITVCGLCLEDCLALFCEEGKGITRFIIAQIDADGELMIFFPREKNKIFVEKVVNQAIDFSQGVMEFFSRWPIFFARQANIRKLATRLTSLSAKKKEIEDALAAVKLQIEILQKRLERLSTK